MNGNSMEEYLSTKNGSLCNLNVFVLLLDPFIELTPVDKYNWKNQNQMYLFLYTD